VTVLVTGAGGFLGGLLVRDLVNRNVHVRALVRSADPSACPEGVETVVGDIRDPACATAATVGCEAVVHLAGKAHAMADEQVEDEEYGSVNVEGTKRLLEASVVAGVRTFLFASSVKVFGERTIGCVDEETVPDPRTGYARSKWSAEQAVASFAKASRFATVSFRLPLVYGPTRKGNLFRMIEAIDHGRFPPLPPLHTVRSMLHVENFVSAVHAVLRSPFFDRPMYIVADAKPYSTAEVYDLLRKELGRGAPRWRMPLWLLEAGARCGDVLETLTKRPMPLSSAVLDKVVGEAWYSPAALMRDVGYRPMQNFEAVVPDLIRHYRRRS
jgi:nucleoside-diphosphate-sugar epimerase